MMVAFREIYFIVIALAIFNSVRRLIEYFAPTTKAIPPSTTITLSPAYTNQVTSFTLSNFTLYYFFKEVIFAAPTLLLLVFFFTIIRFAIGGITSFRKHADYKQYLLLTIDFHFYIVTLILFFIVGFFITDVSRFRFYFIVLLGWDLLWIILGEIIGHSISKFRDKERNEKHTPVHYLIKEIKKYRIWILTNVVLIFIAFIKEPQTLLPALLLLGSFLAAGIDYYFNRDDYFYATK